MSFSEIIKHMCLIEIAELFHCIRDGYPVSKGCFLP